MIRHLLKSTTIAALGLGALMPISASLGYAQESSPVKFAPGNFGTMVSGTITGNEYVDYQLGAKAGQEIFAGLCQVVAEQTPLGANVATQAANSTA
ncbi:hypothetical protein PAF17_19955 [Paracoccus sp. Z330]|uniref:Branched-chain amino acid ABC transporter substrate-binding protein n=1 Tax=Paracoccus onchidii TaxID=3017813 RepID=A0ABT4ZLW1_9RHOB|nr:hypothetical protein [Paracoccus onchidii]MDB6179715.1 hypothetical protein [Paracoccus onchidii]